MIFTTVRNRNEARKNEYEYMKESEQMLQYFQFPEVFAKTAHFPNCEISLYDFGNVYLIFPIEELSVQIDKCKSSVKQR